MTELSQFTGSKHYQIELPTGVKTIRYSLTRNDSEKWSEVTVTSDHIRLEIPDGVWHFRVQAISDKGEFGPVIDKTFTENHQGGR